MEGIKCLKSASQKPVIKSRWFLVSILLTLLLVVSNIFIQSAQATAGVPKILNYQGRLLDSSGNLLGVTATNYCFKFSFYDNETAGNKLWPSDAPSTMTINVKNGVFNAPIGDTTVGVGGDTLNYNFQDNDSIYIDIWVATKVGLTCEPGDGLESFQNLSPRQRIVSAGYAISASTVLGTGQSAIGTTTPVSNAVATIESTSTSAIA